MNGKNENNANGGEKKPFQSIYDWIEVVAISLSLVLLFLNFIDKIKDFFGY